MTAADTPIDTVGTVGTADPTRGTGVAVALGTVAVMLTGSWALGHGVGLPVHPLMVAGLLVAAAAAELIELQLGPRSWYSASAPIVVLAGVVGGPLAGAAAGAATQVIPRGSVWRRRVAEGGLASIQGLVAGVGGLYPGDGGADAAVRASLAVGGSLLISFVGRAFVIAGRRIRPILAVWRRGAIVDVVESGITLPLVAVLSIASATAPALVVLCVATLLAALRATQRANVRHLEQLAAEQAIARLDQLTGAPNRRAFEESLAAEHARIVRGGRPAGLFVVDIDRFKSINDRFGHTVGDEVLVAIVARLTEGLRATDVLARWGGEEITVLAPGVAGQRGLETFAERVRRAVADRPLALTTMELPVTVSVGGTSLDGAEAPDVALARADGALYLAKRTRNAAVVQLPEAARLALVGTATG
jgi:diguanylate cyclase (GGDEF)-like protein